MRLVWIAAAALIAAPTASAAPKSAAQDVATLEACVAKLPGLDDGSDCEEPIMAQCDHLYAACYDRLLAGWDGLLNKSYRELRQRAPAADQARLQTAQRAWIAFRDADCGFYAGVFPGLRPPFGQAACIHEATRERAIQLTRWRDAL